MVILTSDLSTIRHLVENALYSYARAADELDYERVGELLKNSRVNFAGQIVEGHAAVAALYSTVFSSAVRARHIVSNVSVTVDERYPGNLIIAEARYVRFGFSPSAEILSLGDYHATFEVQAAGDAVRFASLSVDTLWPSRTTPVVRSIP